MFGAIHIDSTTFITLLSVFLGLFGAFIAAVWRCGSLIANIRGTQRDHAYRIERLEADQDNRNWDKGRR